MRRRGSTSFDRTEACATAPDSAADRVRRGFAASDPAVTRFRLTDVSRASLMLEQVNLDRIDDKKGSVPGRLYGFVFFSRVVPRCERVRSASGGGDGFCGRSSDRERPAPG